MKTLSDRDARRVGLAPVATTVESLAALPQPRYRPPYGRLRPTETTIFCVEGWFKEVNTEADFDLHVVIAGLEDTTVTIVVEFPDARCSGACASGYAELYTRARQALENRLKTWTTDTPARAHHGRGVLRPAARTVRSGAEFHRVASGAGNRFPLATGQQ